MNLREMFGFDVPIISVVIGEGGSGGALAIGCANYSFIMENAVYYVASPEACAAILWKSREKVASVSAAHFLCSGINSVETALSVCHSVVKVLSVQSICCYCGVTAVASLKYSMSHMLNLSRSYNK